MTVIDSDFFPAVGDTVVLTGDPDSATPAGKYDVSYINPDGTFCVGSDEAIFLSRVIVRYHSYHS